MWIDTTRTLKDYAWICVETDEGEPKIVATITADDTIPADRVRLTPVYGE